MGSLALLSVEDRPLAKDIQDFANRFVRFAISDLARFLLVSLPVIYD